MMIWTEPKPPAPRARRLHPMLPALPEDPEHRIALWLPPLLLVFYGAVFAGAVWVFLRAIDKALAIWEVVTR